MTGYQGSLIWYAIDDSVNAPSATIYGYLTSYGQAGRNAVVLGHLTFDVLLPLAYMYFLVLCLTLIGEKLFGPIGNWRWLTLVPVVAGAADFLENAGIVAMCLGYPAQWTLTVASITGIFTLLKFGLLILSILLVLLGICLIIWRAWKPSQS
jgi:hypothetical protein